MKNIAEAAAEIRRNEEENKGPKKRSIADAAEAIREEAPKPEPLTRKERIAAESIISAQAPEDRSIEDAALYNRWFNSLSPEEQAEEKARQRGQSMGYLDRVRSGVSTMVESATGYGGEAEALLDSLLSGRDYDDVLADIQARNDDFRASDTGAARMSDAAGLLGGAGAGMKIANKAAQLSRTKSKVGRALEAGAVGAAEGAVVGYGMGRGDHEERMKSAGMGAALGGVGAGVGQRLSDIGKSAADIRAEKLIRAEEVPAESIAQRYDEEALDATVRGEVAEQVYRAKRGTSGVDEELTDAETPEALSARIAKELNVEDDAVLQEAVKRNLDDIDTKPLEEVGEIAEDVTAKNSLSVRSGQEKNPLQKGIQNVQKVVAPMVTMVRHEIGEGFANNMSKALVKSLARKKELDDVLTADLEKITVRSESDTQLKADLLNASNVNLSETERAVAWDRAYARAAELTGLPEETVRKEMSNYMATHNGVVRNYTDVVGARLGENILHSQKKPATSTSTKRKTGGVDSIGADEAFLNQSRPKITAQNIELADEYFSPLVTDNRWMRERTQDIEMMDAFKMPKARGPEDEEALAEGTFLLKRLEQEVAKKGGNKEAVAAMNNLGTTALYESMQSSHGIWQTARNLNVATGLANPKSAFLNVLEPFNLMMSNKYTPVEVLRGILSRYDETALAADARELGLVAVQTGDELRKVMREAKGDKGWMEKVGDKVVEKSARGAELAMRYGGQEAASLFGQNSVMRTAVKRAQGMIRTKDGKITKKSMDNFKKVYGDDFDAAEQARIVSGLNKLAKNKQLTPQEYEAVSYFQLVQLDKAQPLTAMGRSYLHNARPEFRPLLLFTTFSTKLLDLITRESAKKLGLAVRTKSKAKRAKLITEAVAGMTYNAGLASAIWAISNQMRQHVFGKELNNFYKEVGLLDENYQETRSGSEEFDKQGFAEDFAYNFLTLPSGGLLPNNPYPYRPRNKVTVGEELDGEGVDIRYPDPESVGQVAGDVLIPTFIPAEAWRQAEKQDSWVPIMSRLPIVGPFLKAPAKQAEKKAEKKSHSRRGL